MQRFFFNWPSLALSLSALVFFQFALNHSGGRAAAVWLIGALLVLQGLRGPCVLVPVPKTLALAGALVAILLGMSWFFSPALTDVHRSLRLVKFLILAWGLYCLSAQIPENLAIRWLAVLFAGILLWQFGLRHWFHQPYGVFRSSHYLAYFTLLWMPAWVGLLYRSRGRLRFGLVLLLPLALDLLYNDGHKPLIPLLAGSAAGAIGLFFLLYFRRPALAWAWLGLCAVLVSILTPEALAFLQSDERAVIWRDSLRLLAANDGMRWLTGWGLGSFPVHFPQIVSRADFAIFSFPHNHALELLYESGALGLVLVMAALIALGGQSVRLLHRLPEPWRWVALINLATLIIWWLFSFFSFSADSSYTLYPLALILGLHARLWEIAKEVPCTGPPSV